MENNANNNVASNTNPTVNTNVVSGVNTSTVNNVAATPVNPAVDTNVAGNVNQMPASQVAVNPMPVNQTGASNVAGNVNPTPVTPVAVNPVPVNQTVATNVVPNVNTTTVGGENNNEEQKKMKKAYIWIGVFVGLVLIIAGVLLYFLLNGSIANRNRLTCTKTTQEDGYDYYIKRYYTFDNDVMVRVYYTYEFRYTNELTDDMYNQTFDAIINNETNGITKYGLNTHIEKKGNMVEITSYEPNYYKDEFDDVKKLNKDEGYSCE